MNYKYYEQKINDIIIKCPIEAGVEILVYNVLDDIVEEKKLSLIDVNRIRKSQDNRLTTEAGVPDMAVVSKDFEFGNLDKGQVFGLIEVKATSAVLKKTEQVEGQKDQIGHYIYTNGLVWQYYEKNKDNPKWIKYLTKSEIESVNSANHVAIDEEKFSDLLKVLEHIDWKA